MINHDGNINNSGSPDIPEQKFFSDNSLIGAEFPVFAKDIAAPGATKYTPAQVESMIVNGRKTASDILGSPDSTIPHKTSAKDVQNLLWFLTACACERSGSSFNRGVIRLSPLTEDQSLRLRIFFANCKEANAHSRPSSHFKELSIGSQKGLDFDKGSLPFDQSLSTLLCGRLQDNSFFVKFEREAVAVTKPIASLRHLKHWVSHVRSGGGDRNVGGKETRRETDGQEEIKRAYLKMVDVLGLKGKTKEQEIKSHSRIFQIFQRVEEINYKLQTLIARRGDNGLNGKSADNLKKAIDEFYEVANSIPDVHLISGREILLDIQKYLSP
ncbi:MAG: hypothetical protein Q8K75_13025 [Chlamydiales bacterium]|nr:hypothetical protein [Chlamydiales bacterium]